jgi:uncharacterized membrane protein
MIDGRILAVLSAMCFGVNPIVLKVGLRNSNSEVGVFIGLLSGLPLLLLVSPTLGGFHLNQLTALATLYFALGGLFGVVLGRTLLYLSINRLGSARAVTFKNAAPVITAILALIFLQEFVEFERWVGIVLVTFGLTMVGRMVKRQTTNPVTLSGLVLASLTPVLYGIRPIFSKLGLNLAALPLEATLISYLTAIILYLSYFVLARQLTSLRTSRQTASFFAMGGMLQVFGLLLLNYALERSEVSVIYPISASAPLVTFILSYTVLRNVERLTIWDLVGTVSVVAGVILLLI